MTKTPVSAAGGSSRISYVDNMRLFAMLGVIFVHVSAKFAGDLCADGQPLGLSWHTANLLDAASRFAVPVFLMITGALLLGSDTCLSIRQVFRRRIVRVAVPLVCWTVVYILLLALTDPQTDLKSTVFSLFSKPAAVHLWYLYALIALYLLLPFLRLIVRHASRRVLLYGLALWLVFSCLWRAAAGLFDSLSLPDYANPDILGGYAGYMLLGWALANLTRIPSRTGCLALYAAGALTTAGATWLMTARAGELNAVFYQYFMPNVVLMAGGVFLLFRRTGESGRADRHVSGWTARIAALSFGVYLCHMLFVELLYPQYIQLPIPAVFQMLLLSLTVLIASLLAAWILSRIPGIRFLFLGEREKRA